MAAPASSADKTRLPTISVPLERDVFLRTLIRHLSGSLQDIVGLKEAEGFISVVGQRMGDDMNEMYRAALGVERLDAEQVADACIDLKRRIQGDFSIVEANDERIVFVNTRCPFGDAVAGRPALCMMTSNVFGTIAAENLGYGRVSLEQTIAAGDQGCRVTLHLTRPPEGEQVSGREYIRSE